jgi:hypothetical protein
MKGLTVFGFIMVSLINSAWADVDAKSLCRETALKYAHYADTGQRGKFGALFTKDGTLVTTSGSRKPAQEIPDAEHPARTTRHVATNHLVRDEDSQLTGTSYFTFYFSPKAQDQQEALPITGQPAAVGVYHDKYAIENGQCKFTERVAKVTFAGE